ncbi:3-oxoacyl-[acyl-carrier-protein] synthase III C-terminal domain-containing protein [Dactylosporangium sp. NPDC048998]|uniref:3-oxoacyl-[acyl-carrier-protein] synthase III C-terminal domain-containing protein n=1 Tax=Dactylosporangium sp. NPDC048998 TaxID=3363976 RepID=UPI0037187826
MVRADEHRLRLHRMVPFRATSSVSITEISSELGLSAGALRMLTSFLGLDRVADAEPYSVLDMLHGIAEEALTGLDRSRVRYLVHAHTMQLVAPPAVGLVRTLSGKLGLREARAFSMAHQNCATGLNALDVLAALLRAEPPGSLALLLVGERANCRKLQVIPGTTVVGDGAVAIVAGLGGAADTVIGSARRTLGEYYQSVDMPVELRRQYQKIYLPTLWEVMRDAVADAGLGLDDIALMLPHNVNRLSWSNLAEQTGFPLERIYLDNVPRTAHCFGADPFVNLVDARRAGAVRPGDAALLVTAGQGGTFAAVVLRIGDVP